MFVCVCNTSLISGLQQLGEEPLSASGVADSLTGVATEVHVEVNSTPPPEEGGIPKVTVPEPFPKKKKRVSSGALLGRGWVSLLRSGYLPNLNISALMCSSPACCVDLNAFHPTRVASPPPVVGQTAHRRQHRANFALSCDHHVTVM